MNTTAGKPVEPAPLSGAFRVGEHVHQLLNLARALSTKPANPTATNSTAGDSRDAGPSGIGAGATAADSASGASEASGVGVDLGGLTDLDCVRWAQDLEQLLRFGQALAVQVAGELHERVTAGRYAETGARGSVALLVQSLQLSASEAGRRIRLAKEVLPVTDTITGSCAPTAHPLLATAFFNGSVSQECALTVSHYLDEATRLASNGRIDQEQAADVEEALVHTAEQQGPDFVRSVGNRIMSHLDPDGHKPSESDLLAKQGLFFRAPRRGLVSLYGACTIQQYEQLMALISFATNPNKHTDIDTLTTPETGAGTGAAGGEGSTDGLQRDNDSGLGNSNDGDGDSQQCDGQESLLEQLHGLSGLFTNKDTGLNPDDSQPVNEPLAPPDPPEPPEPPEPDLPTPPEPLPEPPEPPALEPPAPLTKPALFNGWRRRLEPWEIPPRPPQAPENASPPVFEGDNWFWFGATPTEPQRTEPAQPAEPDRTESEQTELPQPESEVPEPAPPEQDHGFDPGGDNTSGSNSTKENSTKDDSTNDGDSLKDWPHLVYGVNVPAPGNNETLPGLDPIDPLSTNPAVKDTRTHGQKLLDGLISCVILAARTGQLPHNGGLKTQLIITCTEEDLHRSDGLGTAFTTHSGPMPLALFSQSLCDPEITTLTYGKGQEIINAGRTQRLFTPAQRKLIFARDLGCTFPSCTAVATWCEAHHVIPWQEGGETNLDNAALLCGPHHALIHHSQWQVHLIDGTPWFTPPWAVDPTQTKLRNNFHHGLQKPR